MTRWSTFGAARPKCCREHGAVCGLGLQMTLTAVIGEHDDDAATVSVAHDAFDETVSLHSGDQPACGALAQVHDVGEVLGAALGVLG